jgi:hypothetical protein
MAGMDVNERMSGALSAGQGSYRCISADRLMAAQALEKGLSFELGGNDIPAVFVFSSVMFMPSVADLLEVMSEQIYGSASPIGVKRITSELGLLGEEADVDVIDGSVEGLIRGTLLEGAWHRALCVPEGLSGERISLMPAVEAFLERRQQARQQASAFAQPFQTSGKSAS